MFQAEAPFPSQKKVIDKTKSLFIIFLIFLRHMLSTSPTSSADRNSSIIPTETASSYKIEPERVTKMILLLLNSHIGKNVILDNFPTPFQVLVQPSGDN